MTESEQRTAKVKRAFVELTELSQQFLAGLITVDEFLDRTGELGAETPRLQVGDIDPATGLRMLSPEEFDDQLTASFGTKPERVQVQRG